MEALTELEKVQMLATKNKNTQDFLSLPTLHRAISSRGLERWVDGTQAKGKCGRARS